MTRCIARVTVLVVLLCGLSVRAAPGKGPEGIWFGVLDAGPAKLHIAFHVVKQPDGSLSATLDSLDQGATGIPVDRATITGSTVRFEMSKLGATFEGKLAGDTLVGTFTQGRPLPLSLSRVDKLDAPKRPQQPSRPFPYQEQEVTISVAATPVDPKRPGDKFALGGTLSLPAGPGPFPAVVFVTGSGPQDRDETIVGHKPFLVISDALVRRGVATLRVDDRGVGKSGGTAARATTLDFVEDVRSELAWLAARPEIDKRAIGIIGHSEGALIAPIVASKDDTARFIVMLAGPAMTGEQILYAQEALIAQVGGASKDAIKQERASSEQLYKRLRAARTDAEADAVVSAFITADPAQRQERETARELLRSPWLRAFLVLDPVPYLEKVRVPVLALSGERDLQVPKDNLPILETAFKRGKNPDATVKLIRGVNHLFQHCKTGAPTEYSTIEETFAPDTLQLITDWIVARTAAMRR